MTELLEIVRTTDGVDAQARLQDGRTLWLHFAVEPDDLVAATVTAEARLMAAETADVIVRTPWEEDDSGNTDEPTVGPLD